MRAFIRQQDLLLNQRRMLCYSVSFRESGTSPEGVREDLAIGMVAQASVWGNKVRNDFDAVPIFQRPICNATWDHAQKRWVDIVLQGEEGFSFTPTVPYREVLYRCQPFWYRVEMGIDGPVWVSVSAMPLPGYTLAPMFKNGKDFVYRPCFEMALGDDGLPHSRAGLKPFKGDAASLMRTARLFDESAATTERCADWFSDLLLLWVEFASKYTQKFMRGVCLPTARYIAELDSLENGQMKLLSWEGDDYTYRPGMHMMLKGASSGKIICPSARSVFCTLNEDLVMELVVQGDFDMSEYTDGEEIELTLLMVDTGLAVPYLAVASSACLENSLYDSFFWRGKENAWGNVGSLVCDLRMDARRNGDVYEKKLYFLPDASKWQPQLDESWVESDLAVGVGGDGMIRGFGTDSRYPFVIFPNALGQGRNVHFCAYYLSLEDQNLSAFIGAPQSSLALYNTQVNAAGLYMSRTESAHDAHWGGARLILHEGGL